MINYEFFCPVCNKKVKRKEVMPVVTQHETTPKGYPREVIVRAFHFPNCKGEGDLKIKVLEGTKKNNNLEIQKKLKYSFDEIQSRED